MAEAMDEQILKMREKARREKEGKIEDEKVYIDGEYYCFQELELFSGKILIPVPVSFIIMPDELVRQKYPMEGRPQLVLTSDDLEVNYALNYFVDQDFSNEQVEEATDGFQSLLSRMQPGNHFYEKQIKWSNNRCYGWFDFKSPGIDQPLYTLMTFTPIYEKVFHGIFNCSASKMPDWKPIFLQVIHSLQDNE